MNLLVEVLASATVVGISACALVWRYYRPERRRHRALRRTKLWRIGELPEDTVGRVAGTVRATQRTLEAPLTGRACVCYLVTVADDHRTIIREQRGVTFVLEDGSGRALVDTDGADLDRDWAHESASGIGYEPTRRQLDLLAAHGERSHGAVFNRKLYYCEEIVEEGETICVAGAGVREGDPEAPPGEGYRTPPVTRLRLASSPRFRLLITDAPPEQERRRAD